MITANLILRLIGAVLLVIGIFGVITGVIALMSGDSLIIFVGAPITIMSLLLVGVGAIAARK